MRRDRIDNLLENIEKDIEDFINETRIRLDINQSNLRKDLKKIIKKVEMNQGAVVTGAKSSAQKVLERARKIAYLSKD